jgi:energy-coupling factor transport system permease protein
VPAYGFYAPKDTIAHRLHPVSKLVLSFTPMILAMIVYNDLIFNAILLAVTVALLLVARAEWRVIRTFLRLIVVFTVMISISWLLFYNKGPPVVSFWIIKVTTLGILIDVTTIFRFLTLLLASVLLMVITSESELIQGMRTLGIPYIVCFIFMLAIRFLPTLISDFEMIRSAQMSRACEFQKGSVLERARKNVSVLIPLIVIAFNRVSEVSNALEARGFTVTGLRYDRVSYKKKVMGLSDKSLVVSCVTVICVVIFLRFYLGMFQGLAVPLGG